MVENSLYYYPYPQAPKKPWFKGKEVGTGKWVYGNQESKNQLYRENKGVKKIFLVEPKSISRFSALKDVNNKGIYVGDILEVRGENGKERFGIVKYAETSDGKTPKGFYVHMENGAMWKMNPNLNIIKGIQGECEIFEVYGHCYDHYGPEWNDLQEDK